MCVFVVMGLSGCFEITLESTINADGSGLFTNSTDLGAVLSMLKTIGGDQAKELDNLKKDTLVSLAYLKDSMQGLSAMEKQLLEKASLRILLNSSDEKMLINFAFPFTQISDLPVINGILKKARMKAIANELSQLIPGDAGRDKFIPEDDKSVTPDLEDYFDYFYENGKISKKINKEKFAGVTTDPALKSMQEMGQMGAPMILKTIINLPRPAARAEGKGLKLSDDKKNITIQGTIEDFFENPGMFEYLIEY